MIKKLFQFSCLLIVLVFYGEIRVFYGDKIDAFTQGQTTGAIQGNALEITTEAPIDGVTITIQNIDTGLERTTVTNSEGIYFISCLPPGFYTINAVHPGYQQDVINKFPVRLSKTNVVKPPPFRLRKLDVAAHGPTPVAPPTPVSPTPPPQTAPPQTAPVKPPAPQPPPVSQPATKPRPSPAQPVTTITEPDAEQLVNTTNAAQGGNFDSKQLLSLPFPGIRNFDNLALLLPGVALPPQAIGGTVGPGLGPGVGTSGQFSVNGLRSRANNFTIDGSDNNDEDIGVRRQGFTALTPQSLESVQEFQVTTLLPVSEYGRKMGAQLNAVSRYGSDQFHGTLYGFFTDRRLKARDFFDFNNSGNSPITRVTDGRPVLINGMPLVPANPSGQEDPFTRLQYGFTVGGPIIKQQTHFFFSFEHLDINASKESHFAVPTAEERGLFNKGTIGLNTLSGDPVFPTSVAGNAFFSLFPFPNNPVGPYGANTYSEILPANADGSIFSIRLDHNFKALGKDHALSGRYNFTDDNTILPVTGEALFSSLRALVRTQNLSIILNSAISANASNQARFSYGRTSLGFREVRSPFLIPSRLLPNEPFLLNAPLVVNSTLPGQQPLFLAPAGADTESLGTGPLGQISVSGYSPIGVDVFNFPQARSNNTFQYADTFVYNLNKHRITAGFDLYRQHLNSLLDRNFRPLAVFSGAADLSESRLSERLAGLPGFFLGRDFLAVGAPTGFFQTQALFPDSSIGLRFWQENFFISDQIRVRNNFTLTLGLRYEYNTVPTEVNRKIESTFNSPEVASFETLERNFSGVSGLAQFLDGRTKIYRADHNNFAPHIAFAWDPFNDGKTSIRGGYGIYYDQIPGAVISQSRNVFPSFLTLNLAGLQNPANQGQLLPFNPALLAQPGTLSTYNRAALGDPAAFLASLSAQNNFSAGPGFVLPNANLVTPYAQHWALNFEREFNRDFLLSIAYVGTRGVHLLRFATPNLGPNAVPVVDDVVVGPALPNLPGARFPTFLGSTVPPSIAGTNLRPFPLLGAFNSIESDANSTYHSLQIRLDKRYANSLQFTTSYTWSHAIDQVSELFDIAGARVLPQNSFNLDAERGDANFDVRHSFAYSLIWDVPFFQQSQLLGGWQIATIGIFQTGQPYTVISCCDVNIDGNLTDRLNTMENIQAVEKGPVRFNFQRSGSPLAGQGQDGAVGRNSFRAAGIATIDLAVNKFFDLDETRKFEIRTEFFNLFNRVHFGIPVHQLTFPGLGRSVDTRLPARTVQFALRFYF